MDLFQEEHNIILWGTGNEAHTFSGWLEKYNAIWEECFGKVCFRIRGVWDSSTEKTGKEFLNCHIALPQLQTLQSSDAICVVAVYQYDSIISQLSACGYAKGIDFLYWRKFCRDFQQRVLDCVLEILQHLGAKRILQNESVFAAYVRCGDIDPQILSQMHREMEASAFSRQSKDFLSDVLVAYALKCLDAGNRHDESFAFMMQLFPREAVISGLAFYFGENFVKFGAAAYRDSLCTPSRKTVKTIGIYDKRYSNGGGQRVLSVLIPMYLKMGYKVVFFTDEYQRDGEYSLPHGVVRIVLQHKYENAFKSRLEEFSKYAVEYQIDVMCYHHGVTNESFFYEMILFKYLHIPVVIEIHLMFLFLFTKQNYMRSALIDMYRMADKVIVLSRCNEVFWNHLGCRAKYIPNPVENASNIWEKPVRFDKRNGKTILWIGRLGDIGKGAVYLPAIMQRVHARCPGAILKIVGDNDNLTAQRIYDDLVKMGLEQTVQFCGYITDVQDVYEQADLMLMTSQSEAFPLVLVESKLYGVPVVMYELPYLELVQDKRGYIAVPQGDASAAANSVVELLKRDELRKQMSTEAKESLKKFVEYDVAGAWRQVFDELGETKNVPVDKIQSAVQQLLMQEIWDRIGSIW